MSVAMSIWWPEERIKDTLTPEYVFGHLPPPVLPRLVAPLPWGEGLTNENYLDWILSKSQRLFLILVDIGIPTRIFAMVDESLQDVDLPIAAHRVGHLKLSPDGDDLDLDAKFFHAQWRFLVRGLNEGEHIKYTQNEGVPVELHRSGTVTDKDGVEKVILAGAPCRAYLRTQITIGGAPHFFEEEEVLEEIRSLRRLAHDHIFSIHASYFVDNKICVLFSGVYERTLASFLNDVPQNFKRLPKPQRREILLNWPHCLVNALSWLHAHSQAHGAIRPSNILIDSDHRIFLGQFEALDTLLPHINIDDIESYQYGAPERWVRSATIQDTGSMRASLPSGGRTLRKQLSLPSKLNMFNRSNSSVATPSIRSDSMFFHDNTATRIGIPLSPSRFSFSHASSSSGSSAGGSVRSRIISSMKRPSPSVASSSSSRSSSGRAVYMNAESAVLINAGPNATLIRTWESRQSDHEAADMFSLGAVLLDILTHLCKRKLSAFAQHRGAKNRTAGRGGGVADCSFHLDRNIGQVRSWINILDGDAKKRKGEPVFAAVRPMLAVVRCMLDTSPVKRPSAAMVERLFAHDIEQLEGTVKLHCSSKLNAASQSPSPSPSPSP